MKAKRVVLTGLFGLVCVAGILIGQEKEDRTLLSHEQMTAIINEVSGERAMHHVLELVPYQFVRPPSEYQGHFREAEVMAKFAKEYGFSNVVIEDFPTGQTNHPGWSQGETDRSDYDTVEDYNGYSDVSGSVSADGATFDLGDGGSYTRSVTVQSSAIPAGLTGTAIDFQLVTVTVTMPHGERASVSQLFTRTNIMRYRHDS
jgi:hypothetical protein